MRRVTVTFANGDVQNIETVNGASIDQGGVLSLQLESTNAQVRYSPAFWQIAETESPSPCSVEATVM